MSIEFEMKINFDTFAQKFLDFRSSIEEVNTSKISKIILEIMQLLEQHSVPKEQISKLYDKIGKITRLNPLDLGTNTDNSDHLAEMLAPFTANSDDVIEMMAHFEDMANEIHTLATTIFGLEATSQLKQQMQLDQTLNKALSAVSFQEVETIIKKFNDLKIVPYSFKEHTWVKKLPSPKELLDKSVFSPIVKLLLRNGAQITSENSALLLTKLRIANGAELKPDEELLELLISQGFKPKELKIHEIENRILDTPHGRQMIFYGAGKPSLGLSRQFNETVNIRDEALQNMNQGLPEGQRLTLVNLTTSQRHELSKRSYDKFYFRVAWEKRHNKHPFFNSVETSSEMAKRVLHHETFLKAYESAKFEEASKLLKQAPIDLDAPTAVFKQKDSKSARENWFSFWRSQIPLLIKACAEGDINRCRWLINAGANVNICTNTVPPLFVALLTPSWQQKEILQLLIQEGADLNIFESMQWVLFNQGFMLHFLERVKQNKGYAREVIHFLVANGMKPNVNLQELLLASLEFHKYNLSVAYRVARRAFIFYGCLDSDHEALQEIINKEPSFIVKAAEHSKVKGELLEDLKKRDKMLAGMFRVELASTLDRIALSVIEIMVGYAITPESLTPSDRCLLAERCYKKPFACIIM